jgi:CheY-like chemotaxis protein
MPDVSNEILKDWCVLVVEDDPFSQDVASIMLSAYGATVHTADDGIEGLKLAVQLKPDFILSDISMPGMDGWGLIDGLKSDPRTAKIPVIARHEGLS